MEEQAAKTLRSSERDAGSRIGDSPDIHAPGEKAAQKPAPWRGRKRVVEARGRHVAVRCTESEYMKIAAEAQRAGLTIGAYLRALGCGDAGLRAARRPPIERQELARLLGHVGKLGSNVNQLAYLANASGATPDGRTLDAIGDDVRVMRAAIMKALGRGD